MATPLTHATLTSGQPTSTSNTPQRSCSSSSTSATRRPTSAPTAASELVQHWRFATVRESTADELGARAAQPARAARHRASTTSTRRSSPRPSRSCGRSGRRWRARYLGARDAGRRARACGPGCRSAYDNPREIGARPARQRGRGLRAASAAPCVVVDFGTAITYDVVSRRRRVPRRHHLPGRRDLDGGADRARRRAPEDRPHAAARADRQVDGRRDPLRRRLRLRRAWSTGSSRACATSWARRSQAIATGGLAERDRAVLRARSTRSTTCSRSTGLRLIWERNQRLDSGACARCTSPGTSAA